MDKDDIKKEIKEHFEKHHPDGKCHCTCHHDKDKKETRKRDCDEDNEEARERKIEEYNRRMAEMKKRAEEQEEAREKKMEEFKKRHHKHPEAGKRDKD